MLDLTCDEVRLSNMSDHGGWYDMKIKEVSEITGLTEKTIRYYEERQLIFPAATEINGRNFRSYSEKDVDTLNMIAALRKLDFGVADIIVMRDEPERIPEILAEYQEKTENDQQFKSKVLEQLNQVDYQSIRSIEDLASQLMESATDRDLPVADTELQFYRIDGLTREEMDKEVESYYKQLSLDHIEKNKKKIRNTRILFAISIGLSIILGLLLWRNTYYLGYIPAYQDILGWRMLLIPLFALLIVVTVYTLIKMTSKNKKQGEDGVAAASLIGFRYTSLVLICSLIIGIFVSIRSFNSLENLRMDTSAVAMQEWYGLYRMTDHVQKRYFDSEEDMTGNWGFGLYVNQTCYRYPNKDRLNTKMYDLLIWSYDLIYRELTWGESKANAEEKEQLHQLLKEINEELMELSRNIMDRPDLAELTRFDNADAIALRQQINDMVEGYNERTERLFQSINR